MGEPPIVPKPNSVNQSGQTLITVGPSRTLASPRKSARVPRVTTSAGRPPRVTSQPFMKPPSAPTASTTTMAIGRGSPATMRVPRIAPERPTIDSTERSMSPVMMISVMGSAMIATSITELARLAKFLLEMKTSDMRAPVITRAASRRTRSVSQRARLAALNRRPAVAVAWALMPAPPSPRPGDGG